MLALGRYRAKVCACGYHESLANDPDLYFTFDVRTCPVCRGQAQFKRIQDADDEAIRKQQGEKRPPGTPDPADGRRVVTRLMSPQEVQLQRNQTSEVSRGRPQ